MMLLLVIILVLLLLGAGGGGWYYRGSYPWTFPVGGVLSLLLLVLVIWLILGMLP